MTDSDYKAGFFFGNFNSHARVGRDAALEEMRGEDDDFNSHARVGRDVKIISHFTGLTISTHTPV